MELNKKNYSIPISGNKSINIDVTYNPKVKSAEAVIFLHGFKGFKDWGAHGLVAEHFAREGFLFIKFNFSHNGVTEEDFLNFTDLEGFSRQTISGMLQDIKTVLEFVRSNQDFNAIINKEFIHIIGHSLGGALGLLHSMEDKSISRLALWAPLINWSHFFNKLGDAISWQENEKIFVENKRTGQKLPLNYSFLEDYLENSELYDFQKNAAKIGVPLLIAHGTEDEATPIVYSQKLYDFVSHSILLPIEGAGHTFGAKHLWEKDHLPEHLEMVCEETIEFFRL